MNKTLDNVEHVNPVYLDDVTSSKVKKDDKIGTKSRKLVRVSQQYFIRFLNVIMLLIYIYVLCFYIVPMITWSKVCKNYFVLSIFGVMNCFKDFSSVISLFVSFSRPMYQVMIQM